MATIPAGRVVFFGMTGLSPGDLPLPPRRGRRVAAVAGTALAVLALAVAVVVLAAQHRSGRDSDALHPRSSTDPSPTTTNPHALDGIAAKAPCRGVYADRHPEGQAAIRTFRAVAVVRCLTTTRSYAGGGEWSVLVRQVATVGLTELINALTRPNQHSTGGPCPLIAYAEPPILLIDTAGKYLHPAAPTDGCGAPLQGVAHAITAMTWRTVSTTKLNQVQSQRSIDTGCAQQWKNEAAIYARFPMQRDPGNHPVLAHVPAVALHVCIYRGSDDPDVGTLSRGMTLSPQRSAQLRAALAAPGPSGSCAPQSSFAVLGDGNGSDVNVELGGCWRVVRDDLNPGTTGTADPTQVKRLLGLS